MTKVVVPLSTYHDFYTKAIALVPLAAVRKRLAGLWTPDAQARGQQADTKCVILDDCKCTVNKIVNYVCQ